jgi:hypothetical protein
VGNSPSDLAIERASYLKEKAVETALPIFMKICV